MTKDQASKYLPDLFHKMGGGMSIEATTYARAFLEFIYKHGFIVLSQKEQQRQAHEKQGK